MTSEQRALRTQQADEACRAAYEAVHGPEVGVALVAVGGYGRGELAPFSDLDVVLVSDDGVEPGAMAGELWYPLWDAGYKVDHSVRTFTEMLEAAAADVRVALGLLDLRVVAGDTHLGLRLRTALLAQWRRTARERLREVRTLNRRRHEVVGELAHLSVPDLKEAAGGLRDATVLRALVATWLVDVPHADLERCRLALLDVRDVLQETTGRAADRIPPEAWAPLAEALDLPDAEAAQRYVRMHGRRLAHLTRLAWQRVEAVLDSVPRRGPRRPRLTRLAHGVAESGGEVVLDGQVRVEDDPWLLLRAAAEAAERDLVLAPTTAARLVAGTPGLPDVWPAEARGLLVRLLASGKGLLGVWETLEETGALDLVLPEWERIRLLPHASVIHRFTVDRHVVETCVEASRMIRRVSRPDLLMIAALLHDIGKGSGLDHSVAGETVAADVARRLGLPADEQALVATLVRWHLLLPEVATGRDLDDPVTIEEVAAKVGSPLALSLLEALTEADALAASPQAWSAWRARLVRTLSARVELALAAARERTVALAGVASGSTTVPLPASQVVGALGERPDEDEVPIHPDVLSGRVAGSFDVTPHESGVTVTVVSRDRIGLLADVAAVLALQRVSVRGARAWSQVVDDDPGEWGVSVWEVDAEHLDPAVLRQRFEVVARGEADTRRLERRVDDPLGPSVAVRPGASRSATVLEVRAGDRPGLLHEVLTALAGLDVSVRSAHVDTLGPQAVDVFYLCETGAEALSEERAAQAAHRVRAVLTP